MKTEKNTESQEDQTETSHVDEPLKKFTWDETEHIFGGCWRIYTPNGLIMTIDLQKKRGLGFYVLGMIRQRILNTEKYSEKEWEIAEKCYFQKVESIHVKPSHL